MPLILNPQTGSNDPELLSAVAGILRYAAARVLQEPAIVSPNTGFKAYKKRVDFAGLLVHNAEQFAPQAAVLINIIESQGVVYAAANANVVLYRYLQSDNPGSAIITDMDATQVASYSNVGSTSGKSIFDVLAGVNQSDII